MTSTERRIPYRVEFSRILELFASQIYQSPLALLRENVQNAFDAVRMRHVLDPLFDPEIRVTVDHEIVRVEDNGIGMTPDEMETSFWYAGRSSKNTPTARAAGVVGTFGIGAMSNFGVADELTVVSESAVTGERTQSSVKKSELSTETPSISVVSIPSIGQPGTIVEAHLSTGSALSMNDARAYVYQFVRFVNVPVLFNGENLSGATHSQALPSERYAWSASGQGTSLSNIVTGDLRVLGMASGELRVAFEHVKPNAEHDGQSRDGAIVLQQGRNTIQTMRSGFGLATVAVRSIYNWGGIADLPFLKPTAGREALDAASNQILHNLISILDDIASRTASRHPESFNNDSFLRWIVQTKNFALCGNLEVMVRPSGHAQSLSQLVGLPSLRYYSGRDETVIITHASEETPLVVLSARAPRRDCELGYLSQHSVAEVDTRPRVTAELPATSLTFSQSSLAARVTRILEEDYFLSAHIRFGSISGDLPILVTKTEPPVEIYLNPDSATVAPLLVLYDDDYAAFVPFVKDFVRSSVFPRISKLVPSSTRQGSEALLKHLRSNRDWFEYQLEDKADVEEILEELRAGRLTVGEVARRMTGAGRSFLEVSRDGAVALSSVVEQIEDEPDDVLAPDPYEPRPAIDRRETDTEALLLTSEEPVNGYTCFLSLSDRVQREHGDFFLQPHSTEVVWGGRKVIFIFQHHSGHFGLYYDILCPGLIGADSGGGSKVTSTIVTKQRTFIPVPAEISQNFLPAGGEKMRLEVRGEILYLEEPDGVGWDSAIGNS